MMKTAWYLAGITGIRMGPIGVQEMIAIFVVALILFGPKKLPELARTLGKALSEFRRAKNELKSSLETHLRELERETQFSQPSTTTYDYSPARYQHPYEEYGHANPDYSSAAPYEPEPRTPEALPAPQDHNDVSTEPTPTPPENAPVAGTVPRSNGFHPADPVAASSEQERSL
jgi:TatA/E family protein of Tat protein translocase